MSYRLTEQIWMFDGLRAGEKLTLLAISYHADKRTAEAYPSVGRLVLMTGQCERTVQMHLRKLESKGLIENLGPHPQTRSTIFRVNMAGCKNFTPKNKAEGAVRNNVRVQSGAMKGAETAPKPIMNHKNNLIELRGRIGGRRRAGFRDPGDEQSCRVELRLFMGSIGRPQTEADRCFDFYDQKGWRRPDGSEITDYRQVAKAWKSRGPQSGAGSQNGTKDPSHRLYDEVGRVARNERIIKERNLNLGR